MEFIQNIFSGPMLFYSILLGLMLLYWLIILVGLIEVDSLDALFGFGDALEGAGEAAGEAGGDAAGDALAEAAEAAGIGTFDTALGFIGIGTVPVTIVGSILITTLWFLAFCLHYFVSPSLTHLAPPLVIALFSFVVSAFGSYLTTGVITRPLRRVFQIVSTHAGLNLVGRECRIRTSAVTSDFGEAEITVRNSFIILSVRCDEKNDLKKGDTAVIIEYDQPKHLYEVRKL